MGRLSEGTHGHSKSIEQRRSNSDLQKYLALWETASLESLGGCAKPLKAAAPASYVIVCFAGKRERTGDRGQLESRTC
jgi:hypothetical protein